MISPLSVVVDRSATFLTLPLGVVNLADILPQLCGESIAFPPGEMGRGNAADRENARWLVMFQNKVSSHTDVVPCTRNSRMSNRSHSGGAL